VASKADNDRHGHEAPVARTLVRLRIFLSLTSHSSSATCEISPRINTEAFTMRHGRRLARRTEIVRDDDHTTLKFLDGGGESVDGHHIQVVRGFIEQEYMRVLHCQLREDNTVCTSSPHQSHKIAEHDLHIDVHTDYATHLKAV